MIALSIPYKVCSTLQAALVSAHRLALQLLANEREFHSDLESLGDAMRTLIMCLTEVQDVAKIAPVEENFKDILRAVLQGSSFIRTHLGRGRLGRSPVLLIPLAIVANSFAEQIVAAQFRSELDGLKSKFSELQGNFNRAILTQLVKDAGMSPNAPRCYSLVNSLSRCEGEGRPS